MRPFKPPPFSNSGRRHPPRRNKRDIRRSCHVDICSLCLASRKIGEDLKKIYTKPCDNQFHDDQSFG
ncbi:hypothetical protein EVAR_25991_1 [Eumeta japonica]|uniref:Uncharacterized protein n=1 Tax=Eumeta variegata TaxID=151549 RepID=A0A4C1V278_EUMVA|nr:hypothetical protein EVAR_25991_1 [Eumeta japonica]